MRRRTAIVELTPSDLSLFVQAASPPEPDLRAVGMPRHLVESDFYPHLRSLAERRLTIQMWLYGPGMAPEFDIVRLFCRRKRKWLLGGSIVHDSEGDAGRFAELAAGDFMIIEFSGTVLVPTAAKAVFVAAAEAADAGLHAACDGLLGDSSMRAVSPAELRQLIELAGVAPDHPANQLLLEDALEDAALGGFDGQDLLRRRGSRRSVSPEALREAKHNAERVGQLGEEHVDSFLAQEVATGSIVDYEWVSEKDATSPFDFRVETVEGLRLVDAKTTAYEFERPIHVSLAELTEMAEAEEQYDIFRVFEVTDDGGRLRIARDVRAVAQAVLDQLAGLPDGVRADSVSVRPSSLQWEQAVDLASDAPDDE